MHEHVVRLRAPADRQLFLWFEPWAEGLAFPANMEIALHGISPLPGELELDETEERTAVYGWSGSTLRVIVDGEVVSAFDQAVPDVLSRLSTKETTTMLFGAPPVPDAVERAPAKAPWWRFWA
jgi:hypothetical protein